MANVKWMAVLLLILPLFIFSCHDSGQHFTALPSSETHINFTNNLEKREGFGILYYLYYYNGGGVSVGDINNDGLPDIYFTANSHGGNKLYLNKGNFQFEDITEKAGVAGSSDWCSGVTMADVNGDGFLDIYVSAVSNAFGLQGHNELFINNGNGTFTESAAQYGLAFSGYSVQAAFFDFDHDGDLDCFILNESLTPNERIVDTSNRRKINPYAGGRLFRNDLNTPAKKFTDISAQAGIYQSSVSYGLGLAVGDINNDGWDDIYVGNDFHENDYYYINNGDGSFTESSAKHFNHYSRFSMGNDAADYNNDGNLDIITLDMLPPDEKVLKTYGSDERVDIYNYKIINPGYQPQFSRNCLHRNNGDGKSFSDVALMAGVYATDWSWSPLMADFDNDGNKDLFISSGIVKRPGDLDYIRFVSELARQKQTNPSANLDEQALEKMPDGSSHCFLFKGNGDGKFEDKSTDWGFTTKKGYFNGAAYADLNNDGNLDIVVNPLMAEAFIYKNNSPVKNFLEIKCKGDSLNTFGIGTKTYVFQKGRMQYQQLMLTRGFQSSSNSNLHFGLDTTTVIDSLLIVWPDASYQVIKNPAANKLLTVEKKNAAGKFIKKEFFPEKPEPIAALPSLLNEPWKHKEDDFNDFAIQYLIPHELSRRGPKLAVADVNKDGLEDFYVCGTEGQSGKLFIQQTDGKFSAADTVLFAKNPGSKETDALFFDANNDGFPDLYIVCGGNHYTGNNPLLLDRLYLNDGKGHFSQTEQHLPSVFSNKSTVCAADIDGDGDMDLFVGTLADPIAYGFPQTSYLLINDGKGVFRVAQETMIDLKNIGMVTASAFADVNGDGRKDLIVAGEWMPLTLYLNQKDGFKPVRLPDGDGIWQCLEIADVNGDGFPDILAGNWGLNSKLKAGKDSPLKLYAKDFDQNGRVDQVLAYTTDGQEYPFYAKDEFEQVIPKIKKNFLYYADFAGKTINEIFDTAGAVTLEARDLASAVFINDGKGNFRRQDLPFGMQVSPIFTFQRLASPSAFIAGGNLYGVLPYEGRYDAGSLLSFSIPVLPTENPGQPGTPGPRSTTAILADQPMILDIKGQVRDAKWIQTARYGPVLIVARNNESLLFFTNQPSNQPR
ncbi:VCBS repeat-containing protein [Flavitalea flava]